MSSENKIKVLISDTISKEGIDMLTNEGFEVKMDASLDGDALKSVISQYDALIIRSGTTVTADIISAADKLKVIGRAGVGVDNVDAKAATRKGIIVMNTPGGNTISACEHTWALILSLLRNIPGAHQALREGKWDKKKYSGTEIYGKTLGVIGLGKIGAEVAKRAGGFGVRVIAYDPFASKEKAAEIGAELVELDYIISQSDIITIHVPRNDKTKNMINKDALSRMKKEAILINCARGGIVDEKALAEAVSKGVIKGAALDVYEKEPTTDSPVFSVDRIIHTPHLGASTAEAQERVAVEIVKQVVGFFKTGKIVNAVNISSGETDPLMGELAFKLGKLCGQMSGHLTERIVISYKEKVKSGQEDSITRAVLNGYLSQFNEGINYINAVLIAEEKGIDVVTQKETKKETPGSLSIKLDGEIEVSGGVIGGVPRITQINGYNLDIPLGRNLLIIKNSDKPGVIGHIGTVLGEFGVNIGSMEVGRKSAGGQAVTVINVDQDISRELIDRLKSKDSIQSVNSIKVGQ
ncbi:MAG: phosphoglycerate dehydrogenase [Elusimicrobia bacterium]|nr:phosphoglycerate dehydrogenase [Elusimicrobiota bacterium]